MSAGTVFVELDLSFDKFEKNQQKLIQSATSASLSIEKNFQNIGVKSDAIYEAMRRSATNSLEMIVAKSTSTGNEIERAQKATADKIISINEQQFGKHTSFIDSLKQNWIAASAAIVGAWMLIGKGMEYVQLGAKAMQAEESFKLVAATAGESADKILAAMKKASMGTVDESDIMQKAVKGIVLGLEGNQLVKIMEAARISARVTGEDVKTAYENITDAIATGMPKALKKYGLITKEEMALVNAALKAGVEHVDLYSLAMLNAEIQAAKFGEVQITIAEKLQINKARMQDFHETIGKGAATLYMGMINWVYEWVDTIAHGTQEIKDRRATLAKAETQWFDESMGQADKQIAKSQEQAEKEKAAALDKIKRDMAAIEAQKKAIQEWEAFSKHALVETAKAEDKYWGEFRTKYETGYALAKGNKEKEALLNQWAASESSKILDKIKLDELKASAEILSQRKNDTRAEIDLVLNLAEQKRLEKQSEIQIAAFTSSETTRLAQQDFDKYIQLLNERDKKIRELAEKEKETASILAAVKATIGKTGLDLEITQIEIATTAKIAVAQKEYDAGRISYRNYMDLMVIASIEKVTKIQKAEETSAEGRRKINQRLYDQLSKLTGDEYAGKKKALDDLKKIYEKSGTDRELIEKWYGREVTQIMGETFKATGAMGKEWLERRKRELAEERNAAIAAGVLKQEADIRFQKTSAQLDADYWAQRVKSSDSFAVGTEAFIAKLVAGQKTGAQLTEEAWGNVYSAMSTTMNSFFTDVFKGNLKSAGDYFEAFKNTLLESFAKMVADMATKWLMLQALKAGEAGWAWLTAEKGMWEVPSGKDGEVPVVAHEGEMILPKTVATGVRNYFQGGSLSGAVGAGVGVGVGAYLGGKIGQWVGGYFGEEGGQIGGMVGTTGGAYYGAQAGGTFAAYLAGTTEATSAAAAAAFEGTTMGAGATTGAAGTGTAGGSGLGLGGPALFAAFVGAMIASGIYETETYKRISPNPFETFKEPESGLYGNQLFALSSGMPYKTHGDYASWKAVFVDQMLGKDVWDSVVNSPVYTPKWAYNRWIAEYGRPPNIDDVQFGSAWTWYKQLPEVQQGISTLASQVPQWLAGYRYGTSSDDVPMTNWYAGGGIINEPVVGRGTRSGQGYVFGENGPEMITPAGKMGGGSTTNIFRIYLDGEEIKGRIRVVADKVIVDRAKSGINSTTRIYQ